jgi:predicted dehydrogenase
MQPCEGVRRHGLDPRRLDPASLARLKEELFGKHLQLLELDCNQGDQLTRELQHFVNCVQNDTMPRVTAMHGRDAVAVAQRILQSLRLHRWNGRSDGLVGPTQLPTPLGPLFAPVEDQAAA